MPPYTDSIICPTFILGVKDKEYWMLHQDNARPFRTIAELPTRKLMAEYLSDAMVTTLTDFEEAAVEKTADAIKKNPP